MAGLGAHAQTIAQTSKPVTDKELLKEVEGNMFLLCTYADSERWLSGIEPMLYPTGMTFYRPFSYKQRYFEPETLAEQLTDPSQSESLVKNTTWNEGFFGIRFSEKTEDNFLPLFVPLRRVSLAKVERADGFNLYFHLGPFVAPVYSEALRLSILPKFNLTSSVSNVSATKLFILLRDTEKSIAAKWSLSEEFPSDYWEVFEKSLSKAALAKMRNTVLLRLVSLKKRGEITRLNPSTIDDTKNTLGYCLSQGSAYDLSVSYTRLIEPGAERPPVSHQFTLTNSAEEIQASRRYIQIVGNYRSEEIWISPKIAAPGPIPITLEPCEISAPNSPVDQTTSKIAGLRVLTFIRPKRWTAERWWNLVLALLSMVASYFVFRLYSRAGDSSQKVILALMTAFISLSIASLKDVIIRKN